ncbi:hypothetical protein HNR46_002058 [Haloferula luteola]|uniref:Uncharacterized protein n=1 Tax=Haloferula luteola TaxID=595692 RepID=A0A840VDC4_9BACT|nr:hypothetical protein [Haloferula luteola]
MLKRKTGLDGAVEGHLLIRKSVFKVFHSGNENVSSSSLRVKCEELRPGNGICGSAR